MAVGQSDRLSQRARISSTGAVGNNGLTTAPEVGSDALPGTHTARKGEQLARIDRDMAGKTPGRWPGSSLGGNVTADKECPHDRAG